MEKQLLLSARKITIYLEMHQFVVMVECGTVTHQNAQVDVITVVIQTMVTRQTSTLEEVNSCHMAAK